VYTENQVANKANPMAKIGIDCRMYSSKFTGIGRYVYELTKNLAHIDKKNTYVLFFNDPEYDNYAPPSKNIKKIKVNAAHYSLKEQTRFNRILKKEKLDLMHFTHFNAPIFYNAPSIVTIHDLTLSLYPGKKKTSFLHRMVYNIVINSIAQKARTIIAPSNNTKSDIIEILKVPEDKIKVLYEGVNSSFRQIHDETYPLALKEKYSISPPYLLYTGVWRTHKNLINLIKAFHILKTEYKYPGNLVITGRKDPAYSKPIINQTHSLNLDSNIIFTGMVDELDLISIYNGAQVYVFPSLYEGFGLSPLEAMQCGTPVVASNASCIPEICGKESAIYFDPLNPKDMADKIFQVISSDSLQQKLIKNGLERIKIFSWKKMAQKTLDVYKKSLKQ